MNTQLEEIKNKYCFVNASSKYTGLYHDADLTKMFQEIDSLIQSLSCKEQTEGKEK